MARGKDKLFDGVETVRPYVDRALHDDEIRDSLREAFAAAREIYGELSAGNGVGKAATKVVSDKEIQENLRKAVDELRHAADRLQGKEEAHHARNRMLVLAGIAAGVLFNPVTGPATRKWLLDLVGGEESGPALEDEG